MLRFALAILLLLMTDATPAEQSPQEREPWTHARSAGGVEVYTRPVPGSPYKQFRATGVVAAPMAEVVAWWRDASTYPDWVNSCAEARAVEAGPGVAASYLKFDFPYPASDRDVVLRMVEIENGRDRVVVENHNLDDVVPEVEGLVRMPAMHGRWEFRALDAETTQVVYRQHLDPGGRLPGFLMNRVTVDNPIGTLVGLARYAESRRRP